jgi:hypothetical protein
MHACKAKLMQSCSKMHESAKVTDILLQKNKLPRKPMPWWVE